MVKGNFIHLIVLFGIVLIQAFNCHIQAAIYTWTGATSTNWGTATNWSGGIVPLPTDNVIIVSAANNPVLDAGRSVTAFTMTTGSLNLNGFTLSITGNATFTAGTISNGNIIAANTTTIFGNASGGPTISATVSVSAATITMRGTTFSNTVNITKTGTSNDQSIGGNTFSSSLSLINNGTGYLLMTLTNTDTYNGDVSISTTSSGIVYMNYNAAGTQYNGNIIIDNTGTGGTRFGQNTGTSTLASGKTITIGGGGFATGALYFRNFTQAGSTDQTLALTGTAGLYLQSGTTWNGDVDFTAPSLYTNGSTYNGTALLTKTGTTNDAGTGGNTFNLEVEFIITGTGYLQISSGTGNDVFNRDVTINSTGGGIRFSQGTGTSTLANTRSLIIGATGFSSGGLLIRNFTQTGATAQSLSLTGTASLYLQSGTTWNGDVTFSAPSLRLDGSTYNGTASLTKTGTTNDAGNGGNTFNSIVSLTNTGTGYLMSSNTGADTYNNDVNITTSAGIVYMNYNVAGTLYNGNIILENTGAGSIRFGQNTGTSTLAAGKTVTISGSGFTAGGLYFRNFTQNGATAQSLTLTGTATLYLQTGSTWDGDVSFTAPSVRTDGSTYNGTASFTKTGTLNDAGVGGNTFNSDLDINVTGSGYITISGTGNDAFNGNITVSSTGGGVRFSQGTGTSILASGQTIAIGAGGFSAGGLYIRNFTQSGSTAQSLLLTGTASLYLQTGTIWTADVDFTSPSLYLNGSTYNGTTLLTKTGTTNDGGTGGNTFDRELELIVTGTGYLQIGGAGNDIFNRDVIINSTGGGIRFSQNAGTSTLANSRVIQIGATGFSSGGLYIRNFSQIGNTAQNLNLTGTAALYVQTGTTWNGNVTFTAPSLRLDGAIYNGTAILTKTGTSNDQGVGGNTFNFATSLINSGAGYLGLAWNSNDIFNDDVNISTSNGIIYMSNNAANAQYNGNIVLESTGNGGIRFGQGTGVSTLAAGMTISTGGAGFTGGGLYLRNFVQTGATAQTLLLTGSSSLYLQTGGQWNGNIDFTAPTLYLNGSTYNSQAKLTKTGASNDVGSGGNTFNARAEFIVTGAGYLCLSNTTNIDIFNGNIFVNSTGGGIRFSQGTGTTTLASGNTIALGATGFSAGGLYIRNFTQTGATAQSFTLTGTSSLYLQTGTTWNGGVTFSAPTLFLNGSVYNNTALLAKTGTTNDNSNGANTFNGATRIVNQGSGYLLLAGNTTGDIFNDDLTLTTSNGIIYAANSGTTTQFNGNLALNSANTGGIRFGQNTGSCILAAGKTVTIGMDGFSNGGLYFRNFTQTGTTPQSLTLTGSAALYQQQGTTWNADASFTAPSVYLASTTYNGNSTFTKTGSSNDNSNGANVFNAASTFNSNSTGYFRLANGAVDIFNGDATFTQSGTGAMQPAYNGVNSFYQNITVNSTTAITFGAGTGNILFTGTNPQSVNNSGTAYPIFRRMQVNKTSDNVRLNTLINVSVSLTLTLGNILSNTAADMLVMQNGSAVSGASNSSYVKGPVQKIGNVAFTFPVGDGGYYRPIAISAPANNTHSFTAEYFDANPDLTYSTASKDATIDHLSTCEYWILDRTSGASNVFVTLSWDSPASCGIDTYTDLLVARWNGTQWKDHGAINFTGNNTSGTVRSTAVVTSFSPFTLGSISNKNPLPVELLSFNAQPNNTQVDLTWATASETNNDYFVVEKSSNGVNFQAVCQVQGAGNSNSFLEYSAIDKNPFNGTSYYRLKQVDFDGKTHYSNIVSVNFNNGNTALEVFPNPATEQISIYFPGDEVKTFTLYDAAGKAIITSNPIVEENYSMDISFLPKGIYYLRMSSDSNSDFRKIVKN
ncbi:MAG: T9SS type A sorting domain-containing protein [Bacteroidota bacterium]